MATYAVGDVQGCYEQLQVLLDLIGYESACDRLLFVGDLVNRGPRSLEVLRFVRGLGDRGVSVLGNHDLHLLAAALGHRKPSKSDTLAEVLQAPDRAQLMDWLRRRPLLHEEESLGYVMVHAGLPPEWDLETARRCARELEATLAGDALCSFLEDMYGSKPRRWSESLLGADRLRYITNAFTRLRYCHRDGRLDFSDKRPPGRQRRGLIPWFEFPSRRSRGTSILFGHWATLQVDGPIDPSHGVFHLDTGCVWGGVLSAMRLEDRRLFCVPGRPPS